MEIHLKSVSALESSSVDGLEDNLLSYLKTLSPPALDAEFRSLCLHDADEQGLELLLAVLTWLATVLSSRANFELLVAYLYRLLVIYEGIFCKDSRFKEILERLRSAHASNSEHIGGLLHSNLCLLKVFAKVN